jgi:hypothetical protein
MLRKNILAAPDTYEAVLASYETLIHSELIQVDLDSGVGSLECTQDEIHDLQTPDINLPLDPRIKAINKPIAQCDTELHQQRAALNGTGPASAPSSVALVVSPTVLPVASSESIHAQTNMLSADPACEAVLASEATQIQLPNGFAEQTIINTRANSAFQSAQRHGPGKSHVTFAFPSSKALAIQLQTQMMFIALLNNTKGRVGMDTMCQGPGFLTQAFCDAASPKIPISLVSNDPNIKTLPSVTTGNGRTGTAVGFANVQMIIGGFVSEVEFVVFGKFAGFDAVLGQDWLRHHQCVLDMGTGYVIIKTDNRKFMLSSIDTKN